MKIKEKNKLMHKNTLKPNNNNKLEIKNGDIIPESAFASDESRKELNKIKEIEKNVDREKINL